MPLPSWLELDPNDPSPARVSDATARPQARPPGWDERADEREDADAVSTGSTAELPQNLQAQIEEFEDVFTVDTAILKKVVDHFVKELQKGETSSYQQESGRAPGRRSRG